ncbi:MAG TPA: alpha-glucosidase [Caulobacteraceae bacterium]|jgi:alpha-glucosidase
MNVPSVPSPASLTDHAWWRGVVIYQIYPRSFADSNGDGVGDLRGITAHLDHVVSLGVDAVWLSPFFASPMKDFGYDVSDYQAVDPIFGDLADFDRLVERAHGLGLKVIIDQVYSHSSDQHAWFQESRSGRTNPRADWYVWADAKADGSPPSNWQSVFGGPAWTWDARRGQYYLHNFLPSQPDLNLHNIAVQDALLDTARFWLDRGVDGFRLDAINFAMHDPALTDNPPAAAPPAKRTRPFDFQQHLHNQSHPDILGFLERVRALAQARGAFTVAEVGGEHAQREMRQFTEGEARLHSAYGFDFLYADRLTPILVKKALESWPDVPGVGWPSWAFSNHDAPRAISRWAQPQDRVAYARLTLLLLTTLRGNVFVYQGEELGLPQAEVAFEHLRDPEAISNWPLTLGRDGARTPLPWRAEAAHAGFSTGTPWLPVGAEHAGLAVDRQEADPDSVLALTRRLIAQRKASEALRAGPVSVLAATEAVLAFERAAGDERLLCIFNLSAEPQVWGPETPEHWRAIESVNGATAWSFPAFSGLVAERI